MGADHGYVPQSADADSDVSGAHTRPRPLPISTPTTTSPGSALLLHHPGPTPNAVLTPESLVDDPFVTDSSSPRVPSAAAAAAASSVNLSALNGAGQHHSSVPIMSQTAQSSAPTTALPATEANDATSAVQTTTSNHERRENPLHRGIAEDSISAASPQSSSPVVRGHHIHADQPQWHGPGTNNADDVLAHTGTPYAPGRDANTTANPSKPLTEPFPPLHTSSVLPGTKIAQPKPITLPSPGTSTPLPIKPHHLPEQTIRGAAFADNVAQLEATAERLSTGTSSIGDAIRDLHAELKRSDSRRSSILAAHLRAQSEDNSSDPPPGVGQLKRHLSNSSSIVATNIAARYRGYLPGGLVMSGNNSPTGRLRSGSGNSSGRPGIDAEPVLTRHGPGKASVRSVRSTKLSLAEISESEPTSLTKDAFDAADAAPPIEHDSNDNDVTIRPTEQDTTAVSGTESFHKMLDESFNPEAGSGDKAAQAKREETARPATSHSVNTLQEAQDAFVDFDGVHWEPDQEPFLPQFEPPIPMVHDHPELPTPHLAPATMVQPQSYIDPQTGQQMLYYPARVPALLNLPPKLSSKPKAEQRQSRRSKVLSVMLDARQNSQEVEAKRRTGMPEAPRQSFLPDPLAGHRGSFHALSQEKWCDPEGQEPTVQAAGQPGPDHEPENESAPLRRPQRLSRNEPDNRKPRPSRPSNLPPQLRASAFFDLPPAAPEVEVKEGSAMATLDSMLDASTSAPVSAFTNHTFAGKLGSEVYGKEKKYKPKPSASSLAPEDPVKEPKKKRSSRSWFKRGSSHNGEDKSEGRVRDSRSRSPSAASDIDVDTDVPETQRLAESADGESDRPTGDADADESSEEESDDDGAYTGQPTTLLAELQLRKQQQKQRTQPRAYGQASHMTLLEMDAVAETQRKHRQTKRVNLAWEDPDAHADQNGSDDEDVPLAIIAAKHQGAKNMADLERPMGLMERREMEENEPLSHRRARLQGHKPVSMALPKRQSVATLSAHLGGNAAHIRTTSSLPRSQATSEPEEPEVEGETLGERKRRLEAKELPRARPVSNTFSAELLSQFGDLDEAKDMGSNDKNKENQVPAGAEEEEETLGQRRRRLQAEREAREREMSYNNLVGQPAAPAVSRRLSMADVLAAHPKRDIDQRAQKERLRVEQEKLAARDLEARMSAFRMQIPTNLGGPNVERSGGFRSGVYNDGLGGVGAQAVQSTSAINTHGLGPVPRPQRSTAALSAYGMQMPQMGYAQVKNMGAHMSNAGYNPMNPSHYGHSSMALPLQMDMQAPMSDASMKRVDQWRHGVMP
ncbi:hypothetical protein ACRE_075400 [Hapsidospora chrysogenum ATCC 11550]|uniref:Uncharacterized protein n=1 Tax=Hapsidospora chrysogenum (strain ATCC 11550 / CBS 779.69 / DSM 880 / IAM 14645 / JCM 23072 / IMI 49137) TaxID=857340 RepID=A0A086SXA7_HAPC1|nr:hypothetical protein ACRE_075400 [Hapsidospora chrysogenum ATCC 11550]